MMASAEEIGPHLIYYASIYLRIAKKKGIYCAYLKK